MILEPSSTRYGRAELDKIWRSRMGEQWKLGGHHNAPESEILSSETDTAYVRML